MHAAGSHGKNVEEEAQRFASSLLMPAGDIRASLQSLKFSDLGRLKSVWRVSLAALIRRAFDLKAITDRPGGRKHEPGEFDSEEPRLLRSIAEHYATSLGYSNGELARLLVAKESRLRSVYLGEDRGGLRSVGS
jgi:Zn-dependent peptidase ImmA (M78 family)